MNVSALENAVLCRDFVHSKDCYKHKFHLQISVKRIDFIELLFQNCKRRNLSEFFSINKALNMIHICTVYEVISLI